jgi:TPR repeat protein
VEEEQEQDEIEEEDDITRALDSFIVAAEAGGFYSFTENADLVERFNEDPEFEPTIRQAISNNVQMAECGSQSIWFYLQPAEAMKEWEDTLREFADRGSLGASILLGQKAQHGCGLESHIEETKNALTWLEAAAEKWQHPSVFYLIHDLSSGMSLALKNSGDDVDKYEKQSNSFLLRAAQAGHAKAAYIVGMNHACGFNGFSEDLLRGAAFMRYAGSLGWSPQMRIKILNHPASIARRKAKRMADSDMELPNLTEEFGSQPYALLLAESNYLGEGEQYV